MHCRGQKRLRVGAKKDVVAERRAEEPRHLRHVGAAWRDHERRRIVDEPSVPANRAQAGQETEEDPQECRLTRTHPARDDRERPTLEFDGKVLKSGVVSAVAVGERLGLQAA